MEATRIHTNELVRSIRDQLLEEIKGMNPEEFKDFVSREAGKALKSFSKGRGGEIIERTGCSP